MPVRRSLRLSACLALTMASSGDLYIAQVNPTDPGFAPGVTLTYTCNA
jgi:hypothetical protein